MNQSANPIAWDYFYYILNMTPLKKKKNQLKMLCTKRTWRHFNCCSNIPVPCVKNRSKPENLTTQIMWFEEDLDRTALIGDIPLELRYCLGKFAWWKYKTMAPCVTESLDESPCHWVNSTLGGLAEPGSVCRGENGHYISAGFKRFWTED